MKDFIKKALYFDIIYNLTNIFFSNVHLFEKGHIFKIVFSGWELVFLLGFFIIGLIVIGIIKIVSTKVNKFIYESDIFICYFAFLIQSLDWLTLMVADPVKPFIGGILAYFSYVVICFMLILGLYYFWKYRIEICFSAFITTSIYDFTKLVQNFYATFYHIQKPNQLLLGIPLLFILAFLLALTLLLRHFKLFDFRSRKDKWLESQGEGPYKRFS